jgi:hypothetical protein
MQFRSIFSARGRLLAALGTGALLLAGCTGPTPYQPATGYGFNRTGYSDQRIEDNRYMVSFAGNSLTSRETVERYLLFRAAELTVQQGYDSFILVDRNTDRTTRTYVDRPFGPGPYGYWAPSWRLYGPWGWRYYDPFWGDPFFNDFDVRTVDRYMASAEIVMREGPPPQGDVHAFDAHAVIANLRPTIRVPG